MRFNKFIAVAKPILVLFNSHFNINGLVKILNYTPVTIIKKEA